MGAAQLLVAFVTNCLVAVLNAACVRRFIGGPPWLDSFRNAGLYILVTAIASPMLVALGGAFVPILSGGDSQQFWLFWGQWYMSNALGSLTLGPVALAWLSERQRPARRAATSLLPEAMLLGIGLVIVCTFAFELAAVRVPSSFLPALLYLPLPLVLWAAFRFGVKGATAAILIVAVDLIWRTLNGPTLFIAESAEMSVFAIQMFLIGLSIPILLLGASIDEARKAEQAVRESEERMAFAAISADISLWHIDEASDRVWITEHGRRMLGLPALRPATRAMVLAAIHRDDREVARRVLHTSAASTRVVDVEFRVARPDGQVRWIRARPRPRGRPGYAGADQRHLRRCHRTEACGKRNRAAAAGDRAPDARLDAGRVVRRHRP
jgi:integral membrane sensor domain MASE1